MISSVKSAAKSLKVAMMEKCTQGGDIESRISIIIECLVGESDTTRQRFFHDFGGMLFREKDATRDNAGGATWNLRRIWSIPRILIKPVAILQRSTD